MEESQSVFVRSLKNPETREVAFRKLLSDYKERLYWYIRKIVLDHDDANDVTQNTFVRVFLSIDGFKGNSKIFTWMYRIATNEALNFIKSKAFKIGISSEEWLDAKASGLVADSYFDGDAASLKLQKAIAKLPEKQRLVFNMKYFDAMKYEEIAAILKTSIGALKASYHHAVKKIKEEINE